MDVNGRRHSREVITNDVAAAGNHIQTHTQDFMIFQINGDSNRCVQSQTAFQAMAL